MYGNSSYLMHYGTPNMRWYHVGEGKRQENPNKYAHKDQTIGFDDSKWKNSRAYQKLHGIQESLYSKADEAKTYSEADKERMDKLKILNDKKAKNIKFEKDHPPRLPFGIGKKDHDQKILGMQKNYDDNAREIARLGKEYKQYKKSASWNRTLGRLMNIPLAVAFIGYSAGSNLASAIKGIGRTIGSIKLGKNTIGDYAKKFTGLFGKKSSGTISNSNANSNSSKETSGNNANSNSSKEKSDKHHYSLNETSDKHTYSLKDFNSINTNTNSANNSGDSIGLKQRVKYARMSPLELFYSILNGK